MLLNKNTNNIVEQENVPRGRIYDRNYKLLVDNVAVKKIYYLKPKGVTSKEEIDIAYKLIKVLNLKYDNLYEKT